MTRAKMTRGDHWACRVDGELVQVIDLCCETVPCGHVRVRGVLSGFTVGELPERLTGPARQLAEALLSEVENG